MDDLSRDAVAASKLGMSYGRYMANVKPYTNAGEKPPESPKKPTRGQEKHLCCILCGKPIPKASKNRKYCGHECSEKAYRAQQRVSDARRRENARCLKEPEAETDDSG